MSGTITSANASFALAIPGLFSSPQLLQGFMADRAFETEAVDIGEFVRGVDGKLSAGFVPYNIPMTVALMPDSDSSVIFEQWAAYEQQNQTKLAANAVVKLDTGRKYTFSQGYLGRYIAFPSAMRVLQGRPFGLVWGSCVASNA